MIGGEEQCPLVTPHCPPVLVSPVHSGVHAGGAEWSGAGAEWSGVERVKRMKRDGAEWSGAALTKRVDSFPPELSFLRNLNIH